MSKADEKVLVITEEAFQENGKFTGITGELTKYDPVARPGVEYQFLTRAECETDPKYKQLIPYVTLFRVDEAGKIKVFTYSRAPVSGEKRLVGKRSIGIGGHINPEDGGDTYVLSRLFEQALLRELKEEVGLVPSRPVVRHGVIYDDADAVGQVHVGLLHTVIVQKDELHFEDSIHDPQFEDICELAAGDLSEYENWSRLAIKHFAEVHFKCEEKKTVLTAQEVEDLDKVETAHFDDAEEQQDSSHVFVPARWLVDGQVGTSCYALLQRVDGDLCLSDQARNLPKRIDGVFSCVASTEGPKPLSLRRRSEDNLICHLLATDRNVGLLFTQEALESAVGLIGGQFNFVYETSQEE